MTRSKVDNEPFDYQERWLKSLSRRDVQKLVGSFVRYLKYGVEIDSFSDVTVQDGWRGLVEDVQQRIKERFVLDNEADSYQNTMLTLWLERSKICSYLNDNEYTGQAPTNNSVFKEMIERESRSKFEYIRQVLESETRVHRMYIASSLEPELNDYIQTLPSSTYADKKRICAELEAILEPLGLAVQMPKEPFLPGKLAAIAGGYPQKGAFQFQVMVDGKQKKIGTFNDLPSIKIIDSCVKYSYHDVNAFEEDLPKWQSLIRDDAKKSGPGHP